MSKQNIPAEMLNAATVAIALLGADNWKADRCAQAALEAAGVPALLAERDGLRARVAELEAAFTGLQKQWRQRMLSAEDEVMEGTLRDVLSEMEEVFTKQQPHGRGEGE